MKKIILFALCAMVSLCAAAQGQIKTKSFIISDFREKTMNVILTGDTITDALIREQIQNIWSLSPYEFCGPEVLKAGMASDNNYFLVFADKKFAREDEAGIRIIGLYKGKEGAKSLNGMYKVVSIPYCSADDPDGREMTFLPVLLTIMQREIGNIMSRPINISNSVLPQVSPVRKWHERCAIAKCDFSLEPGASMAAIYAEENVDVVDEKTVENYIENRVEGTMVGYVVTPTISTKGSVCYTMLIDASTWELYYISRRKVSAKEPAGFTPGELRAFIARQKKK